LSKSLCRAWKKRGCCTNKNSQIPASFDRNRDTFWVSFFFFRQNTKYGWSRQSPKRFPGL
jgi:hypothetical protein